MNLNTETGTCRFTVKEVKSLDTARKVLGGIAKHLGDKDAVEACSLVAAVRNRIDAEQRYMPNGNGEPEKQPIAISSASESRPAPSKSSPAK